MNERELKLAMLEFHDTITQLSRTYAYLGERDHAWDTARRAFCVWPVPRPVERERWQDWYEEQTKQMREELRRLATRAPTRAVPVS